MGASGGEHKRPALSVNIRTFIVISKQIPLNFMAFPIKKFSGKNLM